mmetsp:Transcript_31102/g.91047  ORF Transcript_31102/g.91047 Transcript_31102/m.91047 type:complete len:762 (-) Transcript_31102:2310-4595(-)
MSSSWKEPDDGTDDEPEPNVSFDDSEEEEEGDVDGDDGADECDAEDNAGMEANEDEAPANTDEPDPDVEFDDGDEESETEKTTASEEQSQEEDKEPKENTGDDISEKVEPPQANVEDNIVQATEEITEKIDELKVDTTIHDDDEENDVEKTNSDDATPPSSGAAKAVNWTNDTKEASATTPTPKSKKSPKTKGRKKSALKDPSLVITDPADRTIKMRNPYPQPTLVPPPRSPEEIIADHTLPTPKIDPPSIVPNDQLLALIDAAQSPSLARRANAIGALRVLASSGADGKKTMPIKLVRTIVVLDALTNAANHTPVLDKALGIGRDEYNTALDARTRSVSLMLLLCQPKENRLRVCHHPGLLDALVKVMEEDTSEARMLASAVVATCAKTKENRQIMAKTPRLITVLSKLLKGEFNFPKEDGDVGDAKADDKIVAGEGGVERLLSMDVEEMEQLKDQLQKEEEEEEMGSDEDSASSRGSALSSNSDYGTFDESDEENSSKDEGRGPRDAGRPIKNIIASDNIGPGNGMREQNLGKYEEFLAKSRMSACAALLHLSKHCPVSPILCEHDIFVENTLVVGEKYNDPIHTRCLELISMITRFPGNNAALARRDGVIDTLLRCTKSKTDEDRKWSMLSLQNLTSEASNKIPMAEASVLKQLRVSALRYDNTSEQIAALSALVNISTEPGTIVPLSSTPNVVATLITLAHSSESSKEVCDLACGCLTNMGLWLQNLASTGTVPDGLPNVPLPTHTSSGWRRWENAE